MWNSGAEGSFTVQDDTKLVQGEVKRDTSAICYLQEGQMEILKQRRLKELAKTKQTKFIGFPVELCVEKSKEKR